MKLGKKLLAVICTISVLLAMVVIPASAFTGSTVTTPDDFVLIEDFENGLEVNNWGYGGSGTISLNTDRGYGESGSSMLVELGSSWSGAKTYKTTYEVQNDGLAFWIYLPQDVPSGKRFVIALRLGTKSQDYGTKYEVEVPLTDLTAGEHMITIPWSDFTLSSGTATFADEGIYITQIEFTTNAGAGSYYVDQIGMCTIVEEVVPEWIPSTLEMPADFTLIENFENGISGSGTGNWTDVGGATYSLNQERGYGESGNSLMVELGSSWKGAKFLSGAHAVTGDGLAFWIYLPQDIPSGKKFAIAIRLDTKSGSYGTKYEVSVPLTDLTAGEHVITIPWSDFTLSSGTATFNDAGICITQVEFTCNAGEGIYYVDQLGMYTAEATSDESTWIPSTIEMPDNFVLIEDFESGLDINNWIDVGGGAYYLNTERGYGESGNSLKVELASGWKGAKTMSGAYVVQNGGLAFWIYLPQDIPSGKKFAVALRLGTKSGDYSTKYEVAVPLTDLTAGEHVITIPWSDFTLSSGTATFNDAGICITQVEFTCNAGEGIYYVDQIGQYGDGIVYIPGTLDMPSDFTVIEDFESEISGDGTANWTDVGGATYTLNHERGYASTGNSLKVELASGWKGAKFLSGDHAVTGDGLAFWIYLTEDIPSGKKFSVALRLGTKSGDYGTKYEVAVPLTDLTAGEHIITIPWSDFTLSSGTATFADEGICITQVEFTSNAGSGIYYVDQIGMYATPKKPEVSTIVFDTSTKCSSAAITGNGNGANGGLDSVKWRLYDIENDPRFTRACWYIADDVTVGNFNMFNVTSIGTLENADCSSAYDFGNVVFWIKSDVADRTLKVTLNDRKNGKSSDWVEFTVTEAGKWQQVIIPVKDFFVTTNVLEIYPDFLENVGSIGFTGKGLENTYLQGEEFKIAGLRIYDSDVPDYSEYADLDTEPTQPEDDGSYNPDSEIIGYIDFTMDTYSGNKGFGTVTKEEFDDFATTENGIKIVAGEGIKDYGMAVKGLSAWFGEDGTGNTIDVSNLEDGYFSMWVRGSRAGMSFYYILFDDTDNDNKTSLVKTYTIKEANTWEEVRIRICDYIPNGALDNEYVAKIQIRTGYPQFNWRYAYADEQWFNTGDVLEVACARVTEGKPIDPFAVVDTGDDETDNDDNQGGDNTGSDTESDTNTGSSTGSDASTNTGSGTTTDNSTNNNTAVSVTSPATGESVTALVMLLIFACVNGLIAAFAKSKIKAR